MEGTSSPPTLTPACVSVIPPGAELAPRCEIKQSQLGKIPGSRRLDGRWHGINHRTAPPATPSDIIRWRADGANLGLRHGRAPYTAAFDCDCDDPALAGALRESTLLNYPDIVLRDTMEGARFAGFFRSDAPVQACKLFVRDRATGKELGRCEIRGGEDQTLIEGKHPNRGNYRLLRSGRDPVSTDGFLSDPTCTPPWPGEPALLDQLNAALATYGAECVRESGGTTATDRAGIDQETLKAPNEEELRRTMARIPNSKVLFPKRGALIKVGNALHAAAVDCPAVGEELFVDFVARYEDGEAKSRDWAQDEYARIHAPHSIGFAYLERLAAQCDPGGDYAAPPREADAPNAVFPETQTPSSEPRTLDVPAFSTRQEREAALLGSADKPFLAWLAQGGASHDLPGDLRALYLRLSAAAAAATDPLSECFAHSAIFVAGHLAAAAADRPRFRKMFRATLRRAGWWQSLGEDDRELLVDTARLSVIKPHLLFGELAHTAGEPLDFTARSERAYVIRGLLPAKGLAAFVGAPGKGKSWLAVEAAMCVATGRAFANFQAEQGSVLYFASEGLNGLCQRFSEYGTIPAHLRLFSRVPPLSELDGSVRFALDAMRHLPPDAPPLRLIVIDVLRATFAGDENDSSVMGQVTKSAEIIARMTGAAVLLVHHAPLIDPTRPRGSSALSGALDMSGAVTKDGQEITLRIVKQKDGIDGQRYRWTLADGRLQSGEAVNDLPAMSIKGLAAAQAVHGMLEGEQTMTRAALNDQLALVDPNRFGGNTSAHRGRKAREIKAALDARYIVERGNNTFALGQMVPEGLATLDELLEGRAV